jgi:hypothetical protein
MNVNFLWKYSIKYVVINEQRRQPAAPSKGDRKMTVFAAHAQPVSMHKMQGDLRTCAVRLVDRRTGALHRINGRPLTLFSRRPAEAAAELLEGRDPSVWEALIEPLDPLARR